VKISDIITITGKLQDSCTAPCFWEFDELECVESEAEMEGNGDGMYGSCTGYTTEPTCTTSPSGQCVWISGRCFNFEQFDVKMLKKTHSAQETQSPNYLLVGALAFFGGFLGVVLAAQCSSKQASNLDDILLERTV